MRHTRISYLALYLVLAWPLAAQSRNPELIIERAVQLQQAGDYSGAAQAYREALLSRPDDVATHVNLGVVLVKLGKFAEAISQYEAAAKLLPGDPRIELNLALAYQKSGHLQQAVKRFETLHAAAPQNSQVSLLLADGLLQLGSNARVIELLQPLAKENPNDLAIAYMLGTALLREQRTGEGEVYLDRILRNGDTAEARFLLGTRMFASGDYPAAVKELGSAIALNPHLLQLQSFYGRALLRTGDPDAALRAFQEELAVNPGDFDANLGVAQILAVRKKFSEASAAAQRALLVRPDSAPASLVLAECLNGVANFRGARSYAQTAVKALPASAEAHQTLSIAYQGLGMSGESARERLLARKLRSFDDPGPPLGQPAPAFSLLSVPAGTVTDLAAFRGKSPVVLVFGSYSCPNFRSSAATLVSLYRRYQPRVAFLLVYIREAHATDSWQSTRNEGADIALAQPASLAEKEQHAVMCTRKLHLPFSAVVDSLDGKVEKEYQAWPSRAFVIGRDGRLRYSTRLTEVDFNARELEAALRAVSGEK